MENSVYVAVFSDQEFHYDDCGCSHLPQFYPVYGVFEDIGDARLKIYDHIYGCEYAKYEEVEFITSNTGNETYVFKYVDETYGGYAIYTLQVIEERITKKSPN
jgi:hypothetical protein